MLRWACGVGLVSAIATATAVSACGGDGSPLPAEAATDLPKAASSDGGTRPPSGPTGPGSTPADAGVINDGGAAPDATPEVPPPAPDPGAVIPLSDEPGRVFYQVHVRAFWDGATAGAADGTGDFSGLVQKLDYLTELGVDTLLLMPVFRSTGAMGYIPLDLFETDQAYGSKAELRMLVDEAHRRGFRVVLDAPVNHVGEGSAWFQRARLRDCEGGSNVSPYCRFFVFTRDPRNVAPYRNWHKPWEWEKTTWERVWQKPGAFDGSRDRNEYYYATFSGVMPDLAFWDYEGHSFNAPVVDEIARFFREWSVLGVDGFRIDAARHLIEGYDSNKPGTEPQNLQLLRKLLAGVRTTRKGASFIAEAWTSSEEIETYLPDATDMALDFPFLSAVREGLDYDQDNAEPLKRVLAHYEATQTKIPIGHRVVFAGNHDVPRLTTQFAGNDSKIRMAHFLALLAPQVPLLFYGEEVGMEGKVKRPGPEPADPSSESPAQRAERLTEYVRTDRAFPWDGAPTVGFPGGKVPLVGVPDNFADHNLSAMRADPTSLFGYVKSLIALRRTFPITKATNLAVSTTLYGSMTGYTLATPATTAGGPPHCRTVVVNMGKGGPYAVVLKHVGAACAGAALHESFAQKAHLDTATGAEARYVIEPYGRVVLDGP